MAGSGNDSHLDALEKHLQRSAGCYFPNIGGDLVSVDLRSSAGSRLSTIYHYALTGSAEQQDVVVKMPPQPLPGIAESAVNGQARPRLAPLLESRTKFRQEHSALRAIELRLEAEPVGGLRALKAFDFIEELNAIVMERRTEPTLKQLLAHEMRFRRSAVGFDVEETFSRVGAWLRTFHNTADLEHTRKRLPDWDDFVQTIQDFCCYLGEREGDSRFIPRLKERVDALVSRVAAEPLPLGLSHGDLAPRNVLASEQGILVLDTRGAWSVPIYEDLAYFLVALETSRLQAYSWGAAFERALLERCRRSFLTGYFDSDEVPHPLLQLFEVQALLDKWASQVAARHRGHGHRGPVGAYSRLATSGALKRHAVRTLARLEEGSN